MSVFSIPDCVRACLYVCVNGFQPLLPSMTCGRASSSHSLLLLLVEVIK